MPKPRSLRGGFTLIELLIAIVIGTIAMFALLPPFLAEGNFFRQGKRQTEAQRDAQLALRAMARTVREGSAYNAGTNTFTVPCGGVQFEAHGDGSFHRHGCLGDATIIDGVRSKVSNFTITPITSRLARVHLEVTHQLRATDPNQRLEILETELFLRNGA